MEKIIYIEQLVENIIFVLNYNHKNDMKLIMLYMTLNSFQKFIFEAILLFKFESILYKNVFALSGPWVASRLFIVERSFDHFRSLPISILLFGKINPTFFKSLPLF